MTTPVRQSDASTDANPYAAVGALAAGQSTAAHADPRPLINDAAFWGMTSTQFLGAFNDNLFKQLVLLLAVTGAAQAGDNRGQDIQSLAMAVFSVPFLLFSGFAGYLAERYSKQRVIVACKVAEIGIVLLGLCAFLMWNSAGMFGVLSVLFLMGTHSAFFGPSKYGVLPELFPSRDLPMANGVILMTTFLAIIFGTALAGWLKETLGEPNLWGASLVCLVIAVAGTQTALLVRRVPPANRGLPFTWAALVVPGEIRALLRRDRQLLLALLASCMFWLIGGLVQPTVNSLGKIQFQLNDTLTSIMAAAMGVGIAVGCILAGFLSRDRVSFGLMRIGAWMIVALLVLLSIPGPQPWNLLRFPGTVAALVLLGLAAGLFAVPLQVFMQSRPPDALKGRTIATMNLANWVAIVMSAGLYAAFDTLVNLFDWPRASCFALTALLMLPVAILYRPRSQDLA